MRAGSALVALVERPEVPARRLAEIRSGTRSKSDYKSRYRPSSHFQTGSRSRSQRNACLATRVRHSFRLWRFGARCRSLFTSPANLQMLERNFVVFVAEV